MSGTRGADAEARGESETKPHGTLKTTRNSSSISGTEVTPPGSQLRKFKLASEEDSTGNDCRDPETNGVMGSARWSLEPGGGRRRRQGSVGGGAQWGRSSVGAELSLRTHKGRCPESFACACDTTTCSLLQRCTGTSQDTGRAWGLERVRTLREGTQGSWMGFSEGSPPPRSVLASSQRSASV